MLFVVVCWCLLYDACCAGVCFAWFVVCCVLFVVWCVFAWRAIDCNLLFVIRCLLFGCCLLIVVCWLVCVVCLLCDVRCVMSSLCVVRCFSSVVCCLLLCCLLCIMFRWWWWFWWLVFVDRCVSFTVYRCFGVRCVLSVVRCLLFVEC